MLHLYASMLYERRILICCSKLSTVSENMTAERLPGFWRSSLDDDGGDVITSLLCFHQLTACVHGSAAMLCPMFWQHVYIPVLPQHLLDYCW